MAGIERLHLQHYIFAKEAFAYLLQKTRGEKECEKQFKLFRPCVGEAILVLSYIFKKYYWKTFIRIRENLKHVSVFERYCSIVPVKKDERYFYNFLLRMSLIFELTMYCSDERFDCFKKGIKCAANYTERQFFESSGGWERLQHVAQYIKSLGRPLTLIMSKENLPFCENIENFPAAVDAIRIKFGVEANMEMLDSKELCCLTKMSESLKYPNNIDGIEAIREVQPREENEKFVDMNQELIFNATEDNTKKSNSELEMEKAVITYFNGCLQALILAQKTSQYSDSADQDVSLKCQESPPAEDYPETGCIQENLSGTKATEFAEADQHSKNDKLDKNLIAREERYNQPTFIAPQEYLDLRKSDNSSKCKHLYSAKMRPPSIRKKLDGHLKKILDENIESQNYNIMPSGDIHVCPPGSPSQDEETLVIFAESSMDEEGNPDIDMLMCLFKKIEIDSQVEEISYSLRPRRVSKHRLGGEPDTQGTVIMEMTASTSGTPSKFPRRSQRKSADTIPNEALYAKVLIRYYKKYFASFLDHCFKTDFSSVEIDIQSTKSSESSESNAESCEYVFAVSARIMAKRKVLLNNPEEYKPVLGMRLYKDSRLETLPLPVQRSLDSQIEKQNYFVVSGGIYGVGPEDPAAIENIWAILYTADGKSNRLEFSKAEASEMPEILSSYETVLEIFFPGAKPLINIYKLALKEILDKKFQDIPSHEQNS